MCNPEELYKLRRNIDLNRQPRHHDALEELHALLGALGLLHPYEFEDTHIDKFKEKACYANGAKGDPATIPDVEVLYRLSTVKGLTKNVAALTVPSITTDSNDEVIWTTIKGDPDFTPEWQPLNEFVEGPLTGRRGFTWWTSLPTLPDNPLCGAHTLGLHNDQIPIYGFMLSCKVKYLRTTDFVRVPTVVDAFDKEIFHTTRDADAPNYGETISLESSIQLEKGADEYALLPLNVDYIQVKCVLLNRVVRLAHTVELGIALRTLLKNYYKTL